MGPYLRVMPLHATALIEQWIDFASLEIDANILRWFIPRIGFAVYLPLAEEAAISALKRALGALNTHLASNTYLVGHSVTLADIIMTCNLVLGFNRIMTKSFTSEFPNVERYFWTMVNQPNFYKILGDIKQAESVPPVQSAKKPSQTKEPAKPKAKDEPKKVTKKESVKAKEEVVGEEEEEAPKPKPKNPLDLLPPSKMILDDWKRLYSNTKTNFREVAIKGINWRDEGSEIDADDSDGCEGLDGLEFESREGETWKKGCAIWHKHKSVLR
ncbi:hypothetical protein RHMOL_Rhmol12G0003700 [Rhododendron molle]|uniref:Uncharacterized protein n=1 Tax=Rhododendron molle TaxID=49168 RepID=A0ACC0LDX0_RHOML|nr:hypothetical protein RHMOL_Rhmol12G0003700 [Rhododendron molle]